MCYSEFNDIMAAIAAMDADVITIETSRSDMELLDAFEDFQYPNQIGPGVYDIHSPNIPAAQQMIAPIKKQPSGFLRSACGRTPTAGSRPANGPRWCQPDRDGGCCQGVARRQQLSTACRQGACM